MSTAMQVVGYPENLIREERERENSETKLRPCQTCGCDTGYTWSDSPGGPVVWCINSKCLDYHTTFTREEWQQDRSVTDARRAHDADL